MGINTNVEDMPDNPALWRDLAINQSKMIDSLLNLTKQQAESVDKAIAQTRYYRRIAEALSGSQLGVSPMEITITDYNLN